MIAVDTNLLVYAHRTMYPEHEAAKAVLEELAASPEQWAIPSPCLPEFWAVVTHPASAGRPSRPDEALKFLAALLSTGARVVYPRVGLHERLLRLAAGSGTLGHKIFDLQIALVAYEAGASEIWTEDRRFTSHPDLPVRHPI